MIENNKNIFVDGLRVSKPSKEAPDFVKLKFGAKVDELVKFLQEHKDDRGWVNFSLLKSKGTEEKEGVLYLSLDTYKKESKEGPNTEENPY